MHLPVATIVLLFALGVYEPADDNCKRCYQNFGNDCYYDLAKKYPGIQEFEMFWVDRIDRPNLNLRGAAYINKTFHSFEGTLKGNRISFSLSLREGMHLQIRREISSRWKGRKKGPNSH